MILLIVGTQFAFDRLTRAVDDWAVAADRSDVVAQIGPSKYVPKRLRCFPMMQPDKFRELQGQAKCMIAHAGMGSILTALELGIPIIIMPRDHRLGEHRNAHQIATASRFRDLPGVYCVDDVTALRAHLDKLDQLVAAKNCQTGVPGEFIANLRSFIDEERTPMLGWLRGGRLLPRSRS